MVGVGLHGGQNGAVRTALLIRVAVASAAIVAPVLLAACGDDGPTAAIETRRVAGLAAEFRANTTTPTTTAATADLTSGTVAASTGEPEPEPVEPTGVVVPVIALDNSFRPEVIEIGVGDEVLWENRGQNEHDVLSVESVEEGPDGAVWGVTVEDFQPGAVYSMVFDEPGEYRYYCSIHGSETVGMVGTVIVNE